MFCLRAHAQAGAEFLRQTPVSVTEFTLSFEYSRLTVRPRTTYTRIEETGLTEKLKLEWGWREHVSLFVYLANADTVQRNFPDQGQHHPLSRGLLDPIFGLNTQYELGHGFLHFGASLVLAIEDQSIHSNQDSNNATGGQEIIPYLGYEWLLGHGYLFGTRLIYTRPLGTRRILDERNKPDYETGSGGESLEESFFVERHLGEMLAGAALQFVSSGATRTQSSGTTSSDDNEQTIASLRAYAMIHFVPSLEILPMVEYSDYVAFNHAVTRSSDRFNAELALRYHF